MTDKTAEAHRVVEICAGAGGQAIGLERADFEHALAVEIDGYACQTLQQNRPHWKVVQGDVADRDLWNPGLYEGVSLLAGGVPCPPFSIAGKQLGSGDKRDLFAWAVELAINEVKPRALLLENVRGLSMPRFAAYRQHVLDRLASADYVGDWRLLHASDFGVAQLRPRFVLVALKADDARYFRWPEPIETETELTVGDTLRDLMGENHWPHVETWVRMARGIAPTLVGGSKKHGGADLGPTRAKQAWRKLGVDAMGVADEAPGPDSPSPEVKLPKLTVRMVARLQGWDEEWTLAGRKTAQYRQVGNAFPPPLAEAVGRSIMKAFEREGQPHDMPELDGATLHDPVYRVLREAGDFLTHAAILKKLTVPYDAIKLERRIAHLSQDFAIESKETKSGQAYKLGEFRAFVGQEGHGRHEVFANRAGRSKIS